MCICVTKQNWSWSWQPDLYREWTGSTSKLSLPCTKLSSKTIQDRNFTPNNHEVSVLQLPTLSCCTEYLKTVWAMPRASYCLVQAIPASLDLSQNEHLHGKEYAWINLSLYTNWLLDNDLRIWIMLIPQIHSFLTMHYFDSLHIYLRERIMIMQTCV